MICNDGFGSERQVWLGIFARDVSVSRDKARHQTQLFRLLLHAVSNGRSPILMDNRIDSIPSSGN